MQENWKLNFDGLSSFEARFQRRVCLLETPCRGLLDQILTQVRRVTAFCLVNGITGKVGTITQLAGNG